MNEQVPEYRSLRAALEAQDTDVKGKDAAARLNSMKALPIDPDAPRQFMSPSEPNSHFLIKPGETYYGNEIMSGTMGLRPALRRDNDVWAEFNNGVCASKDPLVVAWLEGHSGVPSKHVAYHESTGTDARICSVPIGLCRENGPGIDDWYRMKLAQIPLSSRAAGLENEIDIDKYVEAYNELHGGAPSSGKAGGVGAVAEANANADRERASGAV